MKQIIALFLPLLITTTIAFADGAQPFKYKSSGDNAGLCFKNLLQNVLEDQGYGDMTISGLSYPDREIYSYGAWNLSFKLNHGDYHGSFFVKLYYRQVLGKIDLETGNATGKVECHTQQSTVFDTSHAFVIYQRDQETPVLEIMGSYDPDAEESRG